jgi:hypothetical protein
LFCNEIKPPMNNVYFISSILYMYMWCSFSWVEENQQWWINAHELTKWVWHLCSIYMWELTMVNGYKMISLMLRGVVMKLQVNDVLIAMRCHNEDDIFKNIYPYC